MNSRHLPVAGGVILIIVLVLGLCTCCVCGSGVFLWLNPTQANPDTPTVKPPRAVWEDEPPPTPMATVAPPSSDSPPNEAEETLKELESAEIPEADLHELAIRFLGVPPDTPRVAATTSPDYPVGTVKTFQVSNLDEDQNFEIEARLMYKTDHVYMWVEEGLSIDQGDIEEAAKLFEEHTYPTNREFFGSEWTPGVDGDPHLSILHARNLGRTVAGYFSSADSYVKAVREDSNEMEMFYIHVSRGTEIGDPFYNGVLAHEFQHMIHWYNDRNETTWLNEGCSELAMELANRTYPGSAMVYDVGGSEYAYLDNPDTQLNTWPEVGETGSASAHYGASYLFMSYFLDRFGEEATKALVAHDANGMESVDMVLQEELGLEMTHQDLYADWVLANLINDPDVGQGQFAYSELGNLDPAIDETFRRTTQYPQERRMTVQPYGVDYIEVEGREPLTFQFNGSAQTRVMDTDAHSGRYLWWSNREDESDTRLTRIVDLTDAQEAALSFWGWYHIEEDWDYAYVVVGTTDEGTIPADLNDTAIQWTILDDPGLGCTTSNPNNGNLGCGLTGQSGGWQQLTADLTEFAGQEIALTFEYITDAAVNQAGLALDDITISVDGEMIFSDDSESESEGWIPEGFVRHANVLQQGWLVQIVSFGEETTVSRALTGDGAAGEWTIPLSPQADRAVIAISALAPFTTEPAVYEYTLTDQP
ncbi:MAG: hypothetical protein ACP5HG_07525 [Anaerolineae bacterium]